MKKLLSAFLTMAIAETTFVFPVLTNTEANAYADDLNIYVNNQFLTRDIARVDDFDMIPIFDIAGELGAVINRDGDSFSLTMYDHTYNFNIGDAAVYDENGGWHGLDVVPQYIDDNVMIPEKFLSDTFGMPYYWDNVSHCLFLNSDAKYQESLNANTNTTFSSEIGEVNGITYAIRNVNGMTVLPVNTHGEKIGSFCTYSGYVYYVLSDDGSSDYMTWLYRCGTDWNNEELLDSENFDENSARDIIIDNNTAYWNNNKSTTAINLSDGSKYSASTPAYEIYDNGEEHINGDHAASDKNSYNTYNVAVYNGITFFTDGNHNLYEVENGENVLLDTNAYIDGGAAGEYLYYTVYNYAADKKAQLYRIPINGGEREWIDSRMPAGGEGPFFCW